MHASDSFLLLSGREPLIKFWGEEKKNEAVYAVYVKKVCYNRSKNNTFENISSLEWETDCIKVIKAGTLPKLVDSLSTDDGEMESSYVNIFFSTYRSFACAEEILSLLLSRSLSRIMLVWMDMFPEDFYDPPHFSALQQVLEYAKKYCPGQALELRCKYRLDRFLKDDIEEFQDTCIKWLCYKKEEKTLQNHQSVFLAISDEHFAHQLTYMDAELFKKLVPYHCLGSVWSQREKTDKTKIKPLTVISTVNQFNAVSFCVISTVLSDPSLDSGIRVNIIVKWINIAQELRILKNFSSLKAIISALQCSSVHRLKGLWLKISNEKIDVFKELASIFMEDDNQLNCRKLLTEEGSAKFASGYAMNGKHIQKSVLPILNSTHAVHGTVPYLGTFLTDLTMIDTAIPDHVSNGLINFEKRRKEFEILAQIKLLQSAANNYDIIPDENFQKWFLTVPALGDYESYQLSCLIEPEDAATLSSDKKSPKHKSPWTLWKWSKGVSAFPKSASSLLHDMYLQYNGDMSPDSRNGEASCNSLPLSCSANSSNESNSALQEFYVIKVSVDGNATETNGTALYKSIMLNNRDHARTVIANAMLKHGVQGNPDDYELSQLVPAGEITIPNSANVFYAINATHGLHFILRERKKGTPSSKHEKPVMKNFLRSTS